MLGLRNSLVSSVASVVPNTNYQIGDEFAGEIFYIQNEYILNDNSLLTVEGFIGNMLYENPNVGDGNDFANYGEELSFTAPTQSRFVQAVQTLKIIRNGRVYEIAEGNADLSNFTDQEVVGFTCLSIHDEAGLVFAKPILEAWYNNIFLPNRSRFKEGLYGVPLCETTIPSAANPNPALFGAPNMYNIQYSPVNTGAISMIIIDTRAGADQFNSLTPTLDVDVTKVMPIVVRAYENNYSNLMTAPQGIVVGDVKTDISQVGLANNLATWQANDDYTLYDIVNYYGGVTENLYINLNPQRFRKIEKFKNIPKTETIQTNSLLAFKPDSNVSPNGPFPQSTQVTVSLARNKIRLRFIIMTSNVVKAPWDNSQEIFLDGSIITYGTHLPEKNEDLIDALTAASQFTVPVEPTDITVEGGILTFGGLNYAEYYAEIDVTNLPHPLEGTVEDHSYAGSQNTDEDRFRSCIFGLDNLSVRTSKRRPLTIPTPQTCKFITAITLTGAANNDNSDIAGAEQVHIEKVLNHHNDQNFGTADYKGALLSTSDQLVLNTGVDYIASFSNNAIISLNTTPTSITTLSPNILSIEGPKDGNGDMYTTISSFGYSISASLQVSIAQFSPVYYFIVDLYINGSFSQNIFGETGMFIDLYTEGEGVLPYEVNTTINDIQLIQGDIVELRYRSNVEATIQSLSGFQFLPRFIKIAETVIQGSPLPTASAPKPDLDYI